MGIVEGVVGESRRVGVAGDGLIVFDVRVVYRRTWSVGDGVLADEGFVLKFWWDEMLRMGTSPLTFLGR